MASGRRLDICMFVDDGWTEDDAGPEADADFEELSARFNLEFEEDPKMYLGMNTEIVNDRCIKLSAQTYVEQMADKYVPNWRDRKVPATPATGALRESYEKAHLREHEICPKLVKEYSGITGALMYAPPCARPDVNQSIALLARALTFPTEEMMQHAERIVVYLAHTAQLSITIDGSLDGADELDAESDSDWAVGHSTTGFVLFLCCVAVLYSSKRQQCIAMSSTEAEIIAASAAAVEVMYARTLLSEMGLPQERPTVLRVDNSGAVELSRDRKSCHRSRHIDRRFFKVRELVARGTIDVQKVDTKLNRADFLTKALDEATFLRHRASTMGEFGGEADSQQPDRHVTFLHQEVIQYTLSGRSTDTAARIIQAAWRAHVTPPWHCEWPPCPECSDGLCEPDCSNTPPTCGAWYCSVASMDGCQAHTCCECENQLTINNIMNLAHHHDIGAPFTYVVIAEHVDDVVVMRVPTSVYVEPPDP